MKKIVSGYLRPGSLRRWLISGIYRNPIKFPLAVIRSLFATKKLTGAFFPLKVRIGAGQILKITSTTKSKIELTGNFLVNPWGNCSTPSSVSFSDNSHFTILGDFEIGPNVHITLTKDAILKVGGRLNSSGSGITCNSRIMVEKSLTIGFDCIIAWDVFISDSNWHDISGVERCSPVSIGDHVWISHGVSVLNGAVIPSGCIVGAKSLVTGVFDTEKALLAGIPARVIRSGVEWAR